MNAPQWFLEREDSAELIVLLSRTLKDPVVGLQDATRFSLHTIVAILERWRKADVRGFQSIEYLEEFIKHSFHKVRCIYDINNDMYISRK